MPLMFELKSEEEFVTKTECVCDRTIIVDERILGMGYRCVKCGCNADKRVEDYCQMLNIPVPKLTPKQRIAIKQLIKEAESVQ